ncbi:MAG: choice-of-anchor D domain-containing protein [Muribaculaceae bacterium]|nr:choice-of-anchor D domain-containing protein [Muribaculaceae bacterium]
MNYGKLLPNSEQTLIVNVKNKGTQEITPSLSSLMAPFSTSYISSPLAEGEDVDIPIKFNPTTDGSYNETLTISFGAVTGLEDVSIILSGSCANEVTVCDQNTTTDSYLPVYGAWYDADQHNQMIYPADMLTSLVGKNIKGLTFYPNNGLSFSGGQVSIRLTTCDQTTFSSATLITTGIPTDALGSVVPASNAETLTILFDEGKEFNYSGGNLLIDVQTIADAYGGTSFVGVSQGYGSYCSIYSYNTTIDRKYFLPKVSFAISDGSTPLGSVTVNPSALAFGGETFYTGQTEDKTFTVTNTTEDAVTITMTGDNVFTFTPSTVAAGATETITVTYAPTAAGTHNATLAVGDKTVTLTGTATVPPTPTIAASVSELAMNAVVGTPATATVTVTGSNLEGDITVTSTGEGFSVAPTTLPAAGGTVTVTYNPAAAGTHTGAITLTSTGAETVSVTLNGTATAPVISGTVTPASLSFSCQEGQTNTATITVANTGNVAFSPAFSGIAAPFSIEAATEIAAGESKEYTVTYAPTAAGTHTGTLTVTINGVATNVTLNGTATEAPESGELTVADQGSTSTVTSIAPIYGGKYISTGYVQMLYPASMLNDLNNRQITKITFYEKSGINYCAGGVFELLLGETNASSLDSHADESTLKSSATVTGIATAYNSTTKEFTITLSKPYVYNGGNLVIETKVTTGGTSENRTEFYGQQYTNDMVATSYSISGTQNYYKKNILPKATFTYEKARGVELMSPEDGVLNFGEVSVKGYKTKTITVKNNNSAAVTPTFNELAYPYSVTDAPESIAAGETATFSVTMTPDQDTESIDYNNVALTLTFGNQTIAITINGTSHVNEPTMTTDDFAAITYNWVDEEGETQTSNLAQVATEPAQMVELMREVYMNRNVPGNWYRGYTSAGEPSIEVIYPPIGSIVYGSDGYDYSNAYGWNIGFSDNVTDHILTNTTYNYKYFNPNEYKPIKNGVTLLLIEMNDNIIHDDGTWDEIVANYTSNTKPASYEALCTMFGTIFKSVRVVTQSRRMGAGEDAGTIFKLDADKLNRFFLLAKGRLRQFSLDVDRQMNSFINASSTSNSYRETEEVGPFYQMFEQLSPVDLGNVTDVTDVYQNLVNMQSYGIEHDCQSIPFMSYDGVTGHEFNMYGKASITDDCQDVRDLMITIPERRMQWWYVSGGSGNSRDGVPTETLQNDMFESYNKQYVPKMGLFVIHQNEIEGEKQEAANVYDLNLSWTSNLLEFLPTGYGVYKLYRVVTNADGTKTYQLVTDNLDPNTFNYVDHIEMQQTGQVVTYVVQGQDKEQFLTLQMSNERSFVIPGLDRAEQLRIDLNSDYYFSRYDAADQTNNYSNSLIANNTVGTNVKPSYLVNGSQFKFWRATLDEDGEVVVPTEPFVIAEVSNWNASTGGTLTYKDWKNQTDFSSKPYGLGYHENQTTSNISVTNGEVVFDGLKLYDNFSVSVEMNTHPSQYVYYVTLETAVPFNLNDEGTETSNQARSNTVSVPVYKTGMAMKPLTKDQVDSDTSHELPAGTAFDLNARYSSKTEILGYYIYRWADTETAANARSIYENNGDDASPQGQAGNQATYYTVAMNTDYTSRTDNFTMDDNGNHPDVTASFEDNYMFNQVENGDTYTYAPVVELFAPQQAVELPSGEDREDYNTYGGPQQMSAGGVVKLSKSSIEKSNPWEKNSLNYAYYNVYINVDNLSVPEGYELYKIRAWRKAKTDMLTDIPSGAYEVDDMTEYCYDELTYGDANCSVAGIKNYEFGSKSVSTSPHHVWRGTFSARNVGTNYAKDVPELPLTITVRAYFTKNENLGGSKAPSVTRAKVGDSDGKYYYIAEKTYNVTIHSESVFTAIYDLSTTREVVDVTYYNIAGNASKQAFNGVNLVVTRYNDGTTTTKKVIK